MRIGNSPTQQINRGRAHLGAVRIAKEEVLTAASLAKVAEAPAQQLRLRS